MGMTKTTAIQKYAPGAGDRRVVVIDGIQYRASFDEGWQGILAVYLGQKGVGSRESIKTYRKELTQFFRWVDRTGRQLKDLTKIDLLEYRDYLVGARHCSSSTVAGYMVAIKGLYRWAAGLNLCNNIAADIRTHFDEEHIKMHLTREQTGRLLEHFRSTSLRNYAMANLMLRCGLRTIEVSRANVGDIAYIDGQRILYIQGKGRQDKKRWVVIREATWTPIREYLESRGSVEGTDPLFACEGTNSAGRGLSARTVQDICKRGLRAIGLDSHEYSAHSLRHTTGVSILNNGGTVSDVQEVLGHKSIDTSRIYLRSAAQELRLKNPAERFLDDIA